MAENENVRSDRPHMTPTIRIAPVDGGYIAYDVESETVHHLNPMGALVFELCNGERSRETIARSVVRSFGWRQEETKTIEAWIDEALRTGLISLDGEPPERLQEMQPETLVKVAEQLKEEENTSAAYACQSRAAELDPNDPVIWFSLGELAHIEGHRDVALRAYRHYLDLSPNNPEVEHLIVALSDGPAPPRASDDCVRHLYEYFSEFYDDSMREELEYKAPELIIGEIAKLIPMDRVPVDVLDLGCGTGLAGEQIKPLARRLDGVDLSPHMTERAIRRGIYDSVETAELTEWLQNTVQKYHVVVACDVFVYFGDLTGVVSSVADVLDPEGIFGFSVEQGNRDEVQLADNGRYRHSERHVRRVAEGAGLKVLCINQEVLRYEYGEPVGGLVVLLQKEA